MQMNVPVVTLPVASFEMLLEISDLRDPVRDHAIESCIASADLLAKTVVDLRDGVGLNAIRFAKHGAMRIYAAKTDPKAEIYARQLIRSHGFERAITIVNQPVKAAQAEGILPDQAYNLFTDSFDCRVFGNGGLDLFDDVAALCGKKKRILPEVVVQSGVMVNDPVSHATCRFDRCYAFDLSCLNLMDDREYFPVVNENLARHLSPRVLYRQYDFSNRECLEDRVIDVAAFENGICDGILTWFEARYGQALLCNRRQGILWRAAYHPLEAPIPVTAGKRYRLQMSGDGRGDFLCQTEVSQRTPKS